MLAVLPKVGGEIAVNVRSQHTIDVFEQAGSNKESLCSHELFGNTWKSLMVPGLLYFSINF